ncbi:MAG: glutamate--cysteine ligase [bacterium]
MISTVADRIEDRQSDINNWISNVLDSVDVPIYSSFDIRNSGHKVSVVDPNVFPAGFNNICQESLRAAAPVFEQIIRKRFGGGIHTIGIYSEDHTKNSFYFQNLYSLLELFETAGFDALLVTTNDQLDKDPAIMETAKRDKIEIHQLRRDGNGLSAGNETIDLLISNNDFSSGVPEILETTSVEVTPPPKMGWWNRQKSNHFDHQFTLLDELAEVLDIDPWLLKPVTRHVDGVDFGDKTGFDLIADRIDEVIDIVQQHYGDHGVDDKPYAFVKSNQGTYGMGVYSFESGEEFLKINRDTRDSMARRKGGQENSSVIIQEGVPTEDRVESMSGTLVAEPVLYCLEHRPVGGFLRTNEEQSDRNNLNTRGMKFTSEDLCTLFVDDAEKNEGSNMTQDKIEVYKLMATVGTLACGREMAELNTTT